MFLAETKDFIKSNDLYAVVIGTIFSQFLTELFHSFTNDLIMPMLNLDINKNNVNDVHELKDLKIKFFNIKFKVGSFLVSFVRFIIVVCILLMINRHRRISNKLT
jgi:large-conductance mechanosensitive channel